jgi:hypothetical protein
MSAPSWQPRLRDTAPNWFPRTTEVGASAPTISSVSPSDLFNGRTGVVITGTNFGASQGVNGKVIICPTNDVNDSGQVEQTVTAWGDTGITITVVRGALPVASSAFLFVISSANLPVATGYSVEFIGASIFLRWRM